MHYSRFDGNLANGFVDETSNNLLNPTIDNRQVNMWKTNKLTRSTSLFTGNLKFIFLFFLHESNKIIPFQLGYTLILNPFL